MYTFEPMQSLGKPENLKIWRGLTPYEVALSQQQEYWQTLHRDKTSHSFVLGYEHPLIITLGRSAKAANEILAEGIDHVNTDRGGLATLHSPGQLLIYPIINLRKSGLGVKGYIALLCAVTLEFFASQKLEVFYDPKDPGFYNTNGKIGFLGIRIKEGITYHGISLNIHNDVSLFQTIKACGISHRPLTRLVTSKNNEKLFDEWFEIFVRHYNLLVTS